ncbi:MAG: glycerophosphodiester phosphodiesterase [Actinomycetes bacterium]
MRLPLTLTRTATPTRTTTDPASSRLRTLDVAHRGASVAAPENTLAAVRAAAVLGADMVEVDVRRTRDGALVLLHDATLTRTTDAAQVLPGRGPWRIADLTLDEVRRVDAGRAHSRVHAGEAVPTLADLLDLAGDLGLGVQLELKSPSAYPGIVGDLLEELRAWTLRHAGRRRPPVVVQSFEVVALKELAARAPQVRLGVLGTPPLSHLPVLAGWAHQVNPRHVTVDRAYVDRVHELGLECLVWTVDRAWAMRRAVRLGVDGVITNRPDLLRSVLEEA